MSRKTFTVWFLLIPDIVLLFVSLYVAVLLRYPTGLDSESWKVHIQAFAVIYGLWLLVLFIHGVFDIASLRRYTVLVFNIVLAMAVNLFVAVAYFYFQPSLILTPRRFLLIHVGVTCALLLVWHLVIKYFLKNRLVEKVYIFSFTGELLELEQEIRGHEYLGFRILGHLNEEALTQTALDRGSGIILPGNLEANPEVLKRLYELRKAGVVFYNHNIFYEYLFRKVYISRLSEVWFLENISYKEKRLYALCKRASDLVFGLLGIALFILSYPLIAIIIKLTSPGPILFVQARTGQHGAVFTVYKYRTMRTDTPSDTWTSPQDPRITVFGKFLRISRLDELPQCVNLLLGNMSLVGPRPEQPHLVEELRTAIPFYDERHMVKPGITGWAQINNVYAATVAETKSKLQYDLYYIKHRSLLFDVEIILKTIYYVLSWKGR